MLQHAYTRIELPTARDEALGGTRIVDNAFVFSVDKQIGEGTYGQVFMGHDRRTKDKVALKKIITDTKNKESGFPVTSVRELKILSELQHPNVVQLREVVRSELRTDNKYQGSIYMVFDYAEYDLKGLIETTGTFTEPEVKCILKQLLKGLAYCHSNGVMHRDLKSSNILVDCRGTVKLADFGLARPYYTCSTGEQPCFTPTVITLWTRPPELLLGAVRYGPEVDVWSAGCIFAELLTGKSPFRGNEIDQLDKIFDVMGAPTEQAWPGVSTLPGYKSVPLAKYGPRHRLREALAALRPSRPPVSEGAIRLLERMLSLDPKRRISAAEALADDYLWSDPMPCDPRDLPCHGTAHEFTTKMRPREQRPLGHQHQQQHQQHPYNNNGGHHQQHQHPSYHHHQQHQQQRPQQYQQQQQQQYQQQHQQHHAYGVHGHKHPHSGHERDAGAHPDAKRQRFDGPAPGQQPYGGAWQQPPRPPAGAGGAGDGWRHGPHPGEHGGLNRAGAAAGGNHRMPPQQQQQQHGGPRPPQPPPQQQPEQWAQRQGNGGAAGPHGGRNAGAAVGPPPQPPPSSFRAQGAGARPHGSQQ